MRVFLTGATGYIGGAVAAALRKRGHDVTALVRPESEAGALRSDGVVVVAGELATLSDLRETIEQHDVAVHTAFAGTDPVASDKAAVEALIAAKTFCVYTSGVWVLGNGRSDEDSPPHPLPIVAWRAEHEQKIVQTGRGAVLRPGCVYGGRQSLLASWFAAAQQNAPLQVAGDGDNHWAMVNLHDAADCYVRVVERRETGIFHAVDDTRASINECAAAVAPDGKIDHMTPDAARSAMGPFADALLAEQTVSSVKTRTRLGWIPSRTFLASADEQWREWRATQGTS